MSGPRLGLIGFGRLGGLLTKRLARDFEVRVFDTKPRNKAVRSLGAVPSSFEEACGQDVVLVCVPIRNFEGVVRRMGGVLRPGALVVDVCTVKEYPVRVMRRRLPKNVDILATHPIFGPNTAAGGLKGRAIMLSKVRMSAKRYQKVKRYVRSLGLRIVEMTPREHDKRSARSLILTHFIGRSLVRFGAKSTGIDTEGYRRLLEISRVVGSNSRALFEDANRWNAYAGPMRRRLLGAMKAVDAAAR